MSKSHARKTSRLQCVRRSRYRINSTNATRARVFTRRNSGRSSSGSTTKRWEKSLHVTAAKLSPPGAPQSLQHNAESPPNRASLRASGTAPSQKEVRHRTNSVPISRTGVATPRLGRLSAHRRFLLLCVGRAGRQRGSQKREDGTTAREAPPELSNGTTPVLRTVLPSFIRARPSPRANAPPGACTLSIAVPAATHNIAHRNTRFEGGGL